MFGPCAPLQACSWFNFQNQDIVDAQIGIGRSTSHIEIMPIRIPQQPVLDSDLTSSLVSNYLSLEGSIRQRLRVSLGRLNQGMRRFRPGDQAMEIAIALEAAELLKKEGIAVRIVSMPSTTVFDKQTKAYKDSVLPTGLPRIAIEAGVTDYWWKYACAAVHGVDTFGESAPAGVLYKHFGLTADAVAKTVRQCV